MLLVQISLYTCKSKALEKSVGTCSVDACKTRPARACGGFDEYRSHSLNSLGNSKNIFEPLVWLYSTLCTHTDIARTYVCV